MDGFEDNTGVVVMAATNRPAALDSALTRPGRFDRIISMPLPNLEVSRRRPPRGAPPPPPPLCARLHQLSLCDSPCGSRAHISCEKPGIFMEKGASQLAVSAEEGCITFLG